MITQKFFRNYSLFCCVFILLTIFYGVWVRLSLSGDACGESWPICDQGLIPTDKKAWVEWLHRLSSGLSLLFIVFLSFLSFKIYSKNQASRFFSLSSLVFIFIEALIGAVLVLSGLVALNTEAIRVLVLAVHSVNSFLLVAALGLCYKSSFWNKKGSLKNILHFQKPLIYFVLCFPLLAITGNIASLAGQLFPSVSLSSALALDFLPSAHISLKIRPFHPLLAIAFFLCLMSLASLKKKLLAPSLAVMVMVVSGFITLLTLSPLIMKITHLVLAYFLWLYLIHKAIQEKPN